MRCRTVLIQGHRRLTRRVTRSQQKCPFPFGRGIYVRSRSAFLDSAGRACASTGAAADAAVSIDNILAISLSDSAYWTFASTGAAAHARIIDHICHGDYLL